MTFDDYDGEWADVGFDLNHQIVGWFGELCADNSVPRADLDALAGWMKQMVLQNAQGEHLATAVADHLLGRKKTAKFSPLGATMNGFDICLANGS